MTAIRSNLHTHTIFCDGRDTPEAMAEAACRLGFLSLGFSGHSPQTIKDTWYLRDADAYVRAIRALQREYEGRLKIWLGLECDLYYDCDLSPYEYLLGAVHYVEQDGEFFAVDCKAHMDDAFTRVYKRDGAALAKAYYRNVIRCVQTLKPPFFAHFDLVRKFSGDGKGRLFDTADPAYRKSALEALRAVREAGSILEVNTGGMARGYLPTPYPEPFLLEAWREMGGRVIVGSDSHAANTLDYAFPEALALLRRTGFREACRLGATKLIESYEL